MGRLVTTLLADGGDAPPKKPSHIIDNPFFIIILGFLFIYLFLIRPQKREQDAKMKLLADLKKNDRVVTAGGVFGTIVNLKGDEVTLRVDDQNKVKIRFLKSSISRVITPEDEKQDAETDEAKKS